MAYLTDVISRKSRGAILPGIVLEMSDFVGCRCGCFDIIVGGVAWLVNTCVGVVVTQHCFGVPSSVLPGPAPNLRTVVALPLCLPQIHLLSRYVLCAGCSKALV